MRKDIVALLPLRGGSKGIPKKNIKHFNNFPLFYWSAKAVLDSNIKLYISTEDIEIEGEVNKYLENAIILKRPKSLAEDISSTESVISHFIENVNANDILLIQATSPLTQKKNILEAIDMFYKNGRKSLVSGTRQHLFFWSDDGNSLNYDPINRPRRQDWNGTFVENGALYIFSKFSFLNSGSRCLANSTLYEMSNIHSIDIDTIAEWNQAEIAHEKFLKNYNN